MDLLIIIINKYSLDCHLNFKTEYCALWMAELSKTHCCVTSRAAEVTFIVFIEAIEGKPTHWHSKPL